MQARNADKQRILQKKYDFRAAIFLIQFPGAGSFCLEKKLFGVKKEPFFETGGKVSAIIAVKCLGTR